MPLLIMTIFGLKTILNVHTMHTRLHPQTTVNNTNNQRISVNSRDRHYQWKKQDRHLFIMLSVQIIIQAILTLPQVCAKFYKSITMFQLQTPLKLTVDHFIYNFTLLLSFIANGMPFYIYTLCVEMFSENHY